MNRSKYIIITIIFVLGLFLRLYRINSFSEFLGDQGRTGLIIYNAWQSRQLPLVGPPVLSGEFLGPVFYYLLGPAFILGSFNPIVPIVLTAILGAFSILLLFWIVRELTNWEIALGVSAVYAVSPGLVSSARFIWEPNLIPFFVLLYFVAAVKIWKYRRDAWFIVLGITAGILVQLHYPNLLYIPISVIFALAYFFRYKIQIGQIIKIIIFQLLGFLLITFPFIYYESRHQWTDLINVIFGSFGSGGERVFSYRAILNNFNDYNGRLFGRLLPFSPFWLTIFQIAIFVILIIQPGFWQYLFLSIYLFGITVMSLYHGVVFDHYLYFLTPLPFLLTALSLHKFKSKIFRCVLYLVFAFVTVIFLSRTDILNPGRNDLSRIKSITKSVLSQTDGTAFSFALIKSPSFSDLHYRYFFKIYGAEPKPITAKDYRNLFLICESDNCPDAQSLKENRDLRAICYEEHCQGEYPLINLNSYNFVDLTKLSGGVVYLFRKP